MLICTASAIILNTYLQSYCKQLYTKFTFYYHMERYNPWWANEADIIYETWQSSKLKWIPDIINKIKLKPYSLHFLSGPRQVGKTTAIKILIHKLLEKKDPKSIFYYSCDELTDHKELGDVLDNYISARKSWDIERSYIFLDEITFVSDWFRAVKSRIDSGDFKSDVLVLTGSATLDLLKHKELFPGRRGFGLDHVLYPLDFSNYVSLFGGLKLKSGSISTLEKNSTANKIYSESLKELFSQYIITGGFPRSILDFHKYKKISLETVKTYLDWLRGDWSKAGKSDKYMKEILFYLIRAVGTPISWHGISTETSVNSPNTVRSYIETLEGIHSLLILNLITPTGKVEYKKNKKVHFTDPFIFRVMEHYLNVDISLDWLFEATVASHLARAFDVFYWRGSGGRQLEVDVICKHKDSQIGFEVSRGVKRWKAPWHIKKGYLLDRDSLPLYLAALKTE